jgi:hypothetical protein
MDTAEVERDETAETSALTPIDFSQYDFTPGEKAPWRCSQFDCYGPDELGDFGGAVDELIAGVDRADAAARIWEILGAWELRLFVRNLQFLNCGWKGWSMSGGGSGMTTGASILQTQNAMKLFSCNVIGARHNKVVALLSREVPSQQCVAKDDKDTDDQQAAQEAISYLKAFKEQAQMRRRVTDSNSYICTDGAAVFLTYTVASSRFGTESDENSDPMPARQEEVEVFGKLERKVPLMADNFDQMGWIKLSRERSRMMLKARYPWVKDRISGGATKDSMGQLDRMARANVRLAVQASSTSGEAYTEDTTESVYFFRPFQYEAVADENKRQMLYDNFPSGLEVWTAGGEKALIREGSMDDHVAGYHASPGSGQNRSAILTNYMPIQKVLNATISLYDRYNRSAVARRFAGEPVIDCEAINSQSNDPAKVTPVDLEWLAQHSMTMAQVTAIEQVAQPNDAMLGYIQWLIQGAPEAMDGFAPAVFGAEMDNDGEAGTFGEARLNRDQALQVGSLPWGELSTAVAQVCSQAIRSAAENRKADFTVGLPGERVRVHVGKLKGEVLVWSTSTEIPPTIAEQQAEVGSMIQNMGTVPFYAAVLSDPRNLELLRKFPSLSGLKIPGWDDLEQQIEENAKLEVTAPLPNPQLEALKEQIQQLTEQGQTLAAQAQQNPMLAQQAEQQAQQLQQQIAQLTQAMQQMPPLIPSVPVAQDASQDHQIHAAIALSEMKSAKGRKMAHGTQQEQDGWKNLYLHWQAHEAVLKKLTPAPQIPVKASITLDPNKLPSPDAQAVAMERLGLAMPPTSLQPQEQEHEITEETEGVNQQGVPTKRTVSVVGKPLN